MNGGGKRSTIGLIHYKGNYMKKALIVGIDYYTSSCLYGCVNDALSVKKVLERNYDDSKNFDTRILLGEDRDNQVSRPQLKDYIEELFKGDGDVALLYFSGHGYIESTGGYVITSECTRGDDGLSMADILTYANKSRIKNKIIILDCCHAGFAGNTPITDNSAILSEGITILTASTEEQYAVEEDGAGIFTTLFVDGLNGGAANLLGEVTPGSIYAYIDQSLGPWDQRPVFKTNVKNFISLRKTKPTIQESDLRKIKDLFPKKDYYYPLDPTYESEMKGRTDGMPDPIKEHTEIFALLQKFNRVNLVVPVDAHHMWHAAMENKGCKLTPLGEHYRRLVIKGLI